MPTLRNAFLVETENRIGIIKRTGQERNMIYTAIFYSGGGDSPDYFASMNSENVCVSIE